LLTRQHSLIFAFGLSMIGPDDTGRGCWEARAAHAGHGVSIIGLWRRSRSCGKAWSRARMEPSRTTMRGRGDIYVCVIVGAGECVDGCLVLVGGRPGPAGGP